LGTLAFSAVVDGQARAHAYPLEPDAGPAAMAALSRWAEGNPIVSGQGPLRVGADGRALGVPSAGSGDAQASS
jgi:hypothetical protein